MNPSYLVEVVVVLSLNQAAKMICYRWSFREVSGAAKADVLRQSNLSKLLLSLHVQSLGPLSCTQLGLR